MAEWTRGLPQPGKYWAWCMYDGDMMEVVVMHEDGGTAIRNTADSLLGFIVPHPLGITIAEFERIFSHYTPYTEHRPQRPERV